MSGLCCIIWSNLKLFDPSSWFFYNLERREWDGWTMSHTWNDPSGRPLITNPNNHRLSFSFMADSEVAHRGWVNKQQVTDILAVTRRAMRACAYVLLPSSLAKTQNATRGQQTPNVVSQYMPCSANSRQNPGPGPCVCSGADVIINWSNGMYYERECKTKYIELISIYFFIRIMIVDFSLIQTTWFPSQYL
jgi:hypothetical protein